MSDRESDTRSLPKTAPERHHWPPELRNSDVRDALGLASVGAALAGLPVPFEATERCWRSCDSAV